MFNKLFISLLLLLPLFAQAVGEPYTQDKLDALNKSGQPVLVFIHADWCPTCRAQDAVLEKLLPHLNEGKPARTFGLSDDDTQLIKPLCLLTIKPAMYVGNV